MQENENDIVPAGLKDDESVLAGFFDEHRERLWRTVNFRLDRKLVGRVDPDDVLQEAYLAAAQRLHHFEGDTATSLFIWLRLIVNQTMVDVHRRHLGAQMRDADREISIDGRHYKNAATSMSITFHLLGQLTSPSQAAVRAELTQLVEEALEAMDPIDREVLALRHFEELSNSEVAAALDIQQKAASIRYVRAVKRLKSVLARVPGFYDDESQIT